MAPKLRSWYVHSEHTSIRTQPTCDSQTSQAHAGHNERYIYKVMSHIELAWLESAWDWFGACITYLWGQFEMVGRLTLQTGN